MPGAMAHKGLLVDYGGVLTTSVTDSFAAFCGAEGIELELFKRVVLGAARGPESPFAMVETGRLSQEEFDGHVARLLSDACGRAIDPAALKQRLFATVQPDERMVSAVRRARAAGVGTALVSNSWGGRDYPPEIVDGLLDAVVISGEVGLRKPEPEIYLLAAEKIGVRPPACVFVDDFRVNVEGAERVGMKGIHHRSAYETLPKLGRLLGVSLEG
jgi:epoxide hydrolase-like predicted phosphatase